MYFCYFSNIIESKLECGDLNQNLHIVFAIVTSYIIHYLTVSSISVHCTHKNKKAKSKSTNASFNHMRIIFRQCKFNICICREAEGKVTSLHLHVETFSQHRIWWKACDEHLRQHSVTARD